MAWELAGSAIPRLARMMIIDRIEGERAVVELEKGRFVELPLTRIDGNVRDGAAIIERNGNYVVDEDETSRRLRIVSAKRGRLFRD